MRPIKQQIGALKRVLKYSDIPLKNRTSLEDARTTLAALQFIGEKKINHLPELIAAVKESLTDVSDSQYAASKLVLINVLKKMGEL